MIALVIVSHSARLAEGVAELVSQLGQGRVPVAAAGGTSDPENPIGTDAFRVQAAIESVASADHILVFTDLGSAVLSAETALEFLAPGLRERVRLVSAPVVEGAVAAASQAAAGAALAEILREVEPAPPTVPASGARPHRAEVTLTNALGLHARPAARLIRLVRRFNSRVAIRNSTRSAGPFDAASINGILALGARRGDRLSIEAEGAGAEEAVAEIVAFVESGCGDAPRTQPAAEPARAGAPGASLTGIPVSAGIAIGPLVRLHAAAGPQPLRPVEDAEAECERLMAAIRAAAAETRALYARSRERAGEAEAAIFDAQSLFLEDPALVESALRTVREQRANAEYAWQQAAAGFARTIEALDDPYLRARAGDVADIAGRVLRRLTGRATVHVHFAAPSVLAARDLTPSEVQELDRDLTLGILLEGGSASAHSAILARAFGIPAVVGLGPALAGIPESTTVALDGARGAVWVSPGAAEVRGLEGRREAWLGERRAARVERHAAARTRDGVPVRVLANLNRDTEIASALDYGAEGVGVLRTEFLFLDRAAPPAEDEQLAAYSTIAAALGGRPLVIRTLDVGGDKNVPYLEIGPESNPFLGWRGIRVTLARRDILETQVRAILRAAAGGEVEILLPMVSTLAELREAKAVVAEAAGALSRGGIPHGDAKVAVMIEVPAAVAIAPDLAREAAGFSIGTNDLVQYTMAADRTNSRTAGLADPFQPAVLRMLKQTVDAAAAAGISATLCGELAADTLATPLLLGLGLRQFSVSAPLIPDLKRAIAAWAVPDAESAAAEALQLQTAEAVRACLSRYHTA